MLKIISWNVNGFRALLKKQVFNDADFFEWVKSEKPDILCLQEVKAELEQIPTLKNWEDYHIFWNSATIKKGYSGVATFSKLEPTKVNYELGDPKFDNEGRMIELHFKDFILFNVYFPNGKASEERLKYKLEFYERFLQHVEKLRSKGHSIIICGDVNTAHKPIDLARPKENETISGFLPIERAWIDKLLSKGYIDTFRYFHKEPNQYTWWSMRTRARERNVGWRIDYFYVSEDMINQISDSYILSSVMGSDHAPIVLMIK